MNSLAGILRQNEIDATRKSAARARAMNNPVGHPKGRGEGRTIIARIVARRKLVPVGACPALDKLRKTCNVVE